MSRYIVKSIYLEKTKTANNLRWRKNYLVNGSLDGSLFALFMVRVLRFLVKIQPNTYGS
jgi:hypothetical protein